MHTQAYTKYIYIISLTTAQYTNQYNLMKNEEVQKNNFFLSYTPVLYLLLISYHKHYVMET